MRLASLAVRLGLPVGLATAAALGVSTLGGGEPDDGSAAEHERGGGAAPARRLEPARVVELPGVLRMTRDCDRRARTFATTLAVPRRGASLTATVRVGRRQARTVSLGPGRAYTTPFHRELVETWTIERRDPLATSRIAVRVRYESRPETRDCVLAGLRLDERARSHSP